MIREQCMDHIGRKNIIECYNLLNSIKVRAYAIFNQLLGKCTL